jgi:hypothetical protein
MITFIFQLYHIELPVEQEIQLFRERSIADVLCWHGSASDCRNEGAGLKTARKVIVRNFSDGISSTLG